jgi:hypothetical protein
MEHTQPPLWLCKALTCSRPSGWPVGFEGLDGEASSSSSAASSRNWSKRSTNGSSSSSKRSTNGSSSSKQAKTSAAQPPQERITMIERSISNRSVRL